MTWEKSSGQRKRREKSAILVDEGELPDWGQKATFEEIEARQTAFYRELEKATKTRVSWR